MLSWQRLYLHGVLPSVWPGNNVQLVEVVAVPEQVQQLLRERDSTLGVGSIQLWLVAGNPGILFRSKQPGGHRIYRVRGPSHVHSLFEQKR